MRAKNLVHKMYCVYHVFPPTDEEEEFITVTRSPQEYLGCSQLTGMFLFEADALKYAKRCAKASGIRII